MEKTIREYMFQTLEKWSAGRSDSDWDRLGSIFKERLILAKIELNTLAKKDETLSLKDRIALSKARNFGEIRSLLSKV
jgi:hypothetical protein